MAQIDLPARRKLEERVAARQTAQADLQAAEDAADEYAAKLLLSEYGLIVGDSYTFFHPEQHPQGYHGRIRRAEGFMGIDGVSLCLHVSNGYSTIRVLAPNIPLAPGHL